MGQEIQLKLNNNNVSHTVEKVGDGNLQGFTATDLTGAANELKNTLKHNYILIGDSFGIGYTTDDGQTYTATGGWCDKCKTALEALGHTVYINTDYAPGVTGFASSLPFLTLLQMIETHVANKNEITDIIVLGGTNDIGHESDIDAAIEAFVNYAHLHFPMATVSVGCLGSYIGTLYNNIVPHYRHISDIGGKYIGDLTFLFNDFQYLCYDKLHLTVAGYEFYQPYIMEAVLTGKTEYYLEVTYTLALTNSKFTQLSNIPILIIGYSPNRISYYLQGGSASALKFGNADSMESVYTITPSLRLPAYYAKLNQSIVFGIINASSTHFSVLAGQVYPYLTANNVGFLFGIDGPTGASYTFNQFYINQTIMTQYFN